MTSLANGFDSRGRVSIRFGRSTVVTPRGNSRERRTPPENSTRQHFRTPRDRDRAHSDGAMSTLDLARQAYISPNSRGSTPPQSSHSTRHIVALGTKRPTSPPEVSPTYGAGEVSSSVPMQLLSTGPDARGGFPPATSPLDLDSNSNNSDFMHEDLAEESTSPRRHKQQPPIPPPQDSPTQFVSPTETGQSELSQDQLSRQLLGRSLTRAEAQRVGADCVWKQGNRLGAGAYGTVYLGLVPASGKLIAVKQLDYIEHSAADTERVSSIQMETAILSKLRHRNICGYIGSKSTPGADESSMILNILLEYVPGGSIASLIAQFGQLEEPTVKVCLVQACLI
eukprot:TRINITY_DN1188_c0_g1_i1.p1 TRINITY_DN1188_c0_g1~~TRINITY_DN1188_c0_g1_i1.p1  ORF type:complete len:339 (-),score=43.80 TRINITY_DN1188_c0_g1_i1:768-1784(-)